MLNLQYSSDYFKQICADVIKISQNKLGVTQVLVDISESNELNVDVRNQNIETLEQAQTQNLNVTIFKGLRSGSASTCDLSMASINNVIDAAFRIASYTSEDEFSGLPNKEDLCEESVDCSLYHPWDIKTEQAIDIAKQMEQELYNNPKIVNSDGCSVTSVNNHFILANSLGFMNGYHYSSHYFGANAIASISKNDTNSMQTGDHSSLKRSASDLLSPLEVAKKAAKKAADKVGAKKISTRKSAVIFEYNIARELISIILQAISGVAQYKKHSFLLNSINQKILPDFLSISEDPFINKGIASNPFDNHGVKVHKANIIENGIIKQYLLSTYSARKLKLFNNGHAGGAHNICLDISQSVDNNKVHKDLSDMLKHMHTGLLVTEVFGQGLNIITGDYSKGASGFWVENGVIAYPVEEITIAGNLKNMLANIAAVAINAEVGRITTGPIMLESMMIAGN